ncbi:MAG: peptidoglycan DD-metalloendopeptidase family protein [Chitinophagales bacterium]|nr:peptidoglycan DD-metalloendopeptidase family protein [Chitinophagales bacterium]
MGTKKSLFKLFSVLTMFFLISSAFKIFNNIEIAYLPYVNPVCDNATYYMGIRIDTLSMTTYYPKKGESFKNVLLKNGVSNTLYEKVRKAAILIVNLNYSIAGLETTLIKNNSGELKYAILKKNYREFVVLDLDRENPNANIQEKEVVTEDREVAGIIKGDLYSTFKEMDIPKSVIYQMDKIYKYTFNLYKLREGDTIRIKYEEQTLDGVAVRANRIQACVLSNGGKRHYAIFHKIDESDKGSYYDNEGNSLERGFLEKPLKYGRISSKYNKNRFHPILKTNKAHLGTDFAAPQGTPILATADGVVIAATFTKFNGNFVKIKHDNVYTTQYLHMSRFAKGIKNGTRVKQGQVIGYVGSTGLATGPHVCYRFWKNGVQVNPFNENLRFARALKGIEKSDYLSQFSIINQELTTLHPINNYSHSDRLFAKAN